MAAAHVVVVRAKAAARTGGKKVDHGRLAREAAAKRSAASRKLRDYLRGLGPMDRLSWMGGEDCGWLVGQRLLKKDDIDAEIKRIGAAQKDVAGIVPSPARLDDWRGGEEFPPPGKLMRRARRVLNKVEEPVAWPATYLSAAGATYDVIVFEDQRRRAQLELAPPTGSASAAGIRAMTDRRGEIEHQLKLAPESEAALKRQIAAYVALNRRGGIANAET